MAQSLFLKATLASNPLIMSFQLTTTSKLAFYCTSLNLAPIESYPQFSFSISIWKIFLTTMGWPEVDRLCCNMLTYSRKRSISVFVLATSSRPRLSTRFFLRIETHQSTALMSSFLMFYIFQLTCFLRPSRSIECLAECPPICPRMVSILASMSCLNCLMLTILGMMLAVRCSYRCSSMHQEQSSSTHQRHMCLTSSEG